MHCTYANHCFILSSVNFNFCKKILDIKESRIDACLNEISDIVLCELPEDNAWPVDKFFHRTKV